MKEYDFKYGNVIKIVIEQQFGLLKDQLNQYLFFFSEHFNETTLEIGDEIKFISYVDGKGLKAKILRAPKSSYNGEQELDLIKKISIEWLQEGLKENNANLFYYIDEIDLILAGIKNFVIGRKGTGKTAIAEYLFQQNNYDTYTEKLDFKSFPINDLYDKKDTSFSLQNQYITIWKHIIYASVLKMMSINEKIDTSLLKNLRKLFPLDPIDKLERKIKSLTELEVSLSLAGNGIKTTLKEPSSKNELTTLQKSQLFEDIIINYVDGAKYYIIIDALDDDYSDIGKKQEYFYLLNGLFKAVQEITSIFPKSKYNIFPVVFLRDDIYKQIDDSDKIKWRDLVIRIYWNKPKIQRMLSHRITRTLNPNKTSENFYTAWKHLFFFSHMILDKKKKTVFDTIYEQTYARPRDFIVFIKLCCERAIQNAMFIDEIILFKTFDSFSKHLLEDMEYEIKPLIPEISNIFKIFEQMRKKTFSFSEFDAHFKSAISKGLLKTQKTSEEILDELFGFSVIGNITSNGDVIFKYYDLINSLNLDEKIVIKNGLQRALKL